MFFYRKKFYFILGCFILLGVTFAFLYAGESAVSFPVPQENAAPQVAEDDTSDSKPIFPISNYEQNTYEDIEQKYPMDAPTPDNVKTVIEYDPTSGNYIIRTYIGDMEIASPYSMTEQEYRDYSGKQALQRYWREKNATTETNNEDKFSITDMKFDIAAVDKVFGPGGVQVRTQGSAELIFGLRRNVIENPSLPERQRKTISPDFSQKIQLNVNGRVGNKIVFGLNYNTEASFDHDQKLISLKYQPGTTIPNVGGVADAARSSMSGLGGPAPSSAVGGGEDDIIRNIEVGNVSMQMNSALISGSSALFGIKTELQFGKLNVIALASQQNSETKTVSSRGGVQTTDFEINIDDYDANRHFFLSHYFRDNYEKNISKLPYISSGVQINRVEVWITNKRANYDQSRNIVAFMDLAEAEQLDNTYWIPTTSPSKHAENKANNLYAEILNLAPTVRDIQLTNSVLAANFAAFGIYGGEDYEKIETARRLESMEYTLNKDLGYISLRSALNPDEALAVAFEYTLGGVTYQVGEFSTDPVVAPQALIVKLLKSTAQSPSLKLWDLMMKNVYNIGAMQIQPDKFQLNIVYRNDSVGTNLQYITEGDIKNTLLLRVMNLDRLDRRNNPSPDGQFDFVEGYTVNSSTGRIIFPVLEPFGEHLRQKINNPSIANNYIYQELYDSTLVVAQEYSEKNKFRLVGKYKGSSGKEIMLNAMNVPRGSVTVTAGGATLVENVDYTVDYTMGVVRILNQSLLDSSTNIDVKLENQSMFNMQRKTLLGTHLEYQFSKDFSLGGTFMHLSEKPLTTKVNTGNEPISNTIWGLNTSWRAQSQWLTNMMDKLPFVNATQPSTFALNAEFAQLIPGHSNVIGNAGLAYIDDFESTKTRIDLHYPYYWKLSSVPTSIPNSHLSNDIRSGFDRALFSWYYVDRLLNDNRQETPAHLRDDLDSKSNHLTRNVEITEVFPNRDQLTTETSLLSVLNLSYYPTQRGPYNLDTNGMNTDGTLANPAQRWGGMMRRIEQTDFEMANIEYIEFWMMDPFVNDENKTHKGGSLFFHLGDVSEDVLKDGKKFFEHGLSVDGDITKNETTVWGATPRTQSTVVAFDNSPGARKNQDVGLNGLSTEEEFKFSTYRDYVDQVRARVTNPTAITQMTNDPFSPFNDPAGDNYHFYRGSDYDAMELDILSRYKYYNNTEGNSPDASDVSETYSTSATTLPDVEDMNNDNTLNEYEKYYEYKVEIDHGKLTVGGNYITDKITSQVRLKNGKTENVTWYQFRIPVRKPTRTEGIQGFKSIRFIRMYLTDFEEDIHLRFATMDLVRGEWRSYSKSLTTGATGGSMDVQAVNVEENSDKTPINYILPPGITRQTDPGQPQILQQNEQSMLLRVHNLQSGEAKAVYKNTSYDMRQYKRLQMFVHAEKLSDDNTNLTDHELTCFIRLGSDMTNNYYEYEIPLKLTPQGVYSGLSEAHRRIVWPEENMFDFPFTVLTEAKRARNKDRQDGLIASNTTPYITYDPKKSGNRITIVGNPSISDVENIMIGVRNTSGAVKSGEVWVNELRMSDFNEDGGWGAIANVAVGLSDIGAINFSGRIETAGFGGIESNVMSRRMDDMYQINFSASVELGRFLPEKAKIRLPVYYSYTNETLSPKYNPLDGDMLLEDAFDALPNQVMRDSLKSLTQTVATSRNLTVSGAKVDIKSKKPQFYDPTNITFSYSHSETNEHSPEIERNLMKDQKAAINYSYSFSTQPWEPFKKMKTFNNPAFKLIKEFNIYYLPTSISFNTNMHRQFSQMKVREFPMEGMGSSPMDEPFSTDFMWNRQFDFKYNLTRNISLSLTTAMNSSIYEGLYTPEIGKEYYERWRDTVWSSIRNLGQSYAYQQVFNASWNVPINKLPMLDWITNTKLTYNANYNWDRGARIEGNDQMGNIVTSRRDWRGDASLSFEKLYDKSKYLQGVNRRYSAQAQSFQPKTYTQTVILKKNEAIAITHSLGSETLSVSAVNKRGRPIKISYETKDASSLEITSMLDAEDVSITVTTRNPNTRSFSQQMLDFSVRTLMLLRSASISYSESSSLVMPGFKPEAGFMGQQSVGGIYAPGYGFAFGFHDDNTVEKARNNDWLYLSNELTTPSIMAKLSTLDIKVGLEPIPGLKIDLDAKRNSVSNTTIQHMVAGMPQTFTGNFSITTIAIATSFKKVGDINSDYNSELFNTFLANRQIVADRLNSNYTNTRYPNGGYFVGTGLEGNSFNPLNGQFEQNSADVLIPAFLAAYTGRDAKKVGTSPFLSILDILPNWRVSYDGLSRLEFIKKHFRSVRITHAYVSSYTIGSFSSFSTWMPIPGQEDGDWGYRNVQSALPIPSSPFDISTVTIMENFNPLVGINAVLKNSLAPKLEYRKQRNMSLNLASLQLIETNSDEFVVGLGYVLKDFDVILRLKNSKQSKVKNDLTINADVSYKDVKSLLRKIEENVTQASSGNKMITIKVMLDYVFSSRMNIRLFYDQQMNTPFISTSYPTSASNFGMSFKFMLTR